MHELDTRRILDGKKGAGCLGAKCLLSAWLLFLNSLLGFLAVGLGSVRLF